MPVSVKICGLSTTDGLRAAISGGAAYVGFVFYPPSSRAVTADHAAELAGMVPEAIERVGLFVNPHDDDLEQVVERGAISMIQLHGEESPERVTEVRERFGLPVIKAIPVGSEDDLAPVAAFEAAADLLLFDGKPPKTKPNALPGGNAIRFDWSLLSRISLQKPWMLAGGLNVGNLADAVQQTGAAIVDVSSGVESAPGVKDPDKIAELLTLAQML